ncbi:MAG: type II secretion system protein GspG [Verrucomicrobiota bacterium]|nr:type II secretion system protein GspG [Verrucomicrobiota bacterium]MED5471162.1 type II secretion system protein GspG [Verrucomicrobiota bacterium]MEE2966565.1 type II secretion system protein GspG [Verrucomicrobiota bacterium]
MFKDAIKGINSIVNRLALAIVIIIVFAIFISPIFSSRKKVKRVKGEMSKIAKDLELYHAENNKWPSSGASSVAAALNSEEAKIDPWGKPYRYFFSNDGYAIQSAGPDGVFAEGHKSGRDDQWYSRSLLSSD